MAKITMCLLASRWASERVVPSLGPEGSASPACHTSVAASKLLENTTITVNEWAYPGPPDSFLDYEWETDWIEEMGAFGILVRPSNKCPLDETEVLSRIVSPALMIFKDIVYPRAFGVENAHPVLIAREQKTKENTVPDITIWPDEKKSEAYVTYVEGKGPLSAEDHRLNEELDTFYGKTIVEVADEVDPGSLKLLGQVSSFLLHR